MRNKFALYIILNTLLASNLYLQAQPSLPNIVLGNPSFEDYPSSGRQATKWADCGGVRFIEESPPDVQPSKNPENLFFEVSTKAFDGETYLGMVTRQTDTWESVGQRLTTPLEPGKCYQFSAYLCRSGQYKSSLSKSDGTVNFTQPIKLRIWGGSQYCEKIEMLAESPLISNTAWQQYAFKFEPKSLHRFIILEAFYNTPTLMPYNGNILVDNLSAISVLDCSKKPVLAEAKPKPTPPAVLTKPKTPPVVVTQPKPVQPKPSNPTSSNPIVKPTPTPPTTVVTNTPKPNPSTTEKPFLDVNTSKLKEGQIIKIDRVYFAADSSKMKTSSYPVLDELYQFLVKNSDLIIEVGGHTNGIPPDAFCDRLSTERAKAVYDYLIGKGIPSRRLAFKGYGKRKPLASDATQWGRQQNQRVEVKILSLGGTG